jgi:hypothetical protein
MHTEFWSQIFNKIEHLEELDVDGTIALKWRESVGWIDVAEVGTGGPSGNRDDFSGGKF